jgi:S1-C subfamily serine protease
MRIFWPAAAVALFSLLPRAGAADPQSEGVKDSVVKIYATLRQPDAFRPWTKQSPQEASGSGVVVEGKRVLTNAHVVTYASQVFVEGNQSSEKVAAEVEAIAPGIDLAVLKLEDESFFERRPPLARKAELPEVKDAVMTYGYPTGGNSLSITKGIVSRIEFVSYGHQTSGVRIQIDAAINPGNSGGPAVVDDKMIGLNFSGLRGADNIGYIIPTEEIELFLKDVADGKYDGKPAMFDNLQTLENDALRKFLNFDKRGVGMVVHEPAEPDDSSYPLKKWDIITKVGDHEVDNTGLVRVKDGLRLRFQYYIQKLASGGKLPLTLVRDGKEMTVELPVKSHRDMLIESLNGKYPSYFVFGPLVFSPATTEYASNFDRFQQVLGAMGSPLVTRRGDRPKFEGEQLVVVASRMFPHRIGKGYSDPFIHVVKEINGVKIKNIRHLVETLRDTKDKYVRIVFDDHNSETIVFDRKEVLNATEDILSDNGVRQQASEDLLPIWKKEK